MSETKPTREVTLDFIRNHALFSGLGEEGLIHILTVGTDVMFKKEDYVVKDGESGEDFFLVLQGSLEVIKKISTSDGETIERISLINRGETFGEMAMIERMPRSASVRAIENTLALQFSHEKFGLLEGFCPPYRNDHDNATMSPTSTQPGFP